MDDEEDEVELARIIVAPAVRSKGVGVALVRTLLMEALATGRAGIFLRVRPENAIAIRTYARAGFRRVDDALAAEWNTQQPVDYVGLQYSGEV